MPSSHAPLVSQLELLSSEGQGVLEAPNWVAGEGLLVSDAEAGGVFRLLDGGRLEPLVEHRKGIGGLAQHAGGGLLVTGRNVAHKGFEGEPTRVVAPLPEGATGFNDLVTDAAGCVYVGVMGIRPLDDLDGLDATPSSDAPAAGGLWFIDLDGSARQVAGDIVLPNGVGLSPDGRALYFSDSLRRVVYRYTVGERGELHDRRVFARTQAGLPDGLAVAEDGTVWLAVAHAGVVAVYDASGRQLGEVEVPVPMATSVCFGGDDLRDLYVTTGRVEAPESLRACVYRGRAAVAGLPRPPARVALPAASPRAS